MLRRVFRLFDTERFQAELRDRLAQFALTLHPPDKTRLIQFGRRAAEERERAGLGRPETPFADQANDATVADPVLDETDQLIVFHRIDEGPNRVCFRITRCYPNR